MVSVQPASEHTEVLGQRFEAVVGLEICVLGKTPPAFK